MRLAGDERAQSVLIYTDSLRAPSETFITGLIDCVSSMRDDVSILTHWVYEPWKDDWRVNVISRDLARWRPAWIAGPPIANHMRVRLAGLEPTIPPE